MVNQRKIIFSAQEKMLIKKFFIYFKYTYPTLCYISVFSKMKNLWPKQKITVLYQHIRVKTAIDNTRTKLILLIVNTKFHEKSNTYTCFCVSVNSFINSHIKFRVKHILNHATKLHKTVRFQIMKRNFIQWWDLKGKQSSQDSLCIKH